MEYRKYAAKTAKFAERTYKNGDPMHGRVSVICHGKIVWSDDDCEIFFHDPTPTESLHTDEFSLIKFQPKPEESRRQLMGNTDIRPADTANKKPWYLGACRRRKKRF